ncbi:MAG TPA: hypothetical protein VMU85_13100 [Stellaceae bacterium]|nr:hypothetical protein [Stellaceae bacterium]
MRRLMQWVWIALLGAALAWAAVACAPADHPYSGYGAGAHGGGNR